jgi:hypothetical protein
MPNTTILSSLDEHGVRSDADVVSLVDAMLERAVRRQCWCFFLDAVGLPVHLLIPIADIPVEPVDDGAERMTEFLAGLLAETDATQIVIAWERPWEGDLSTSEWIWVSELDWACRRAHVPLRGQVLVDPLGTMWIDPHELDPVPCTSVAGSEAA